MPKKTLPIFIFNQFNQAMSENVVMHLWYYEDSYGKEGIDSINNAWGLEGDKMLSDDDFVVKMYINSAGGYVSDLFAITDTMASIKKPVETYCLGTAASCGAVLLASGAKGKRYIGKNSSVLLHQVSAVAFGQIEDMDIAMKQAKRVNEQIIDILAKRCGKPKAQIKEDLSRDLWLNAKQAVEYGVVDKIIEDEGNEVKTLHERIGHNVFTVGQPLEKKLLSSKKETHTFAFEMKGMSEDENNFYFEGYPSVFNTTDNVNDVIHTGAFSRTLKTSRVMNKPNERALLCLHDMGELPIGKVTLSEDSFGLKCCAVLPKEDTFVSGRVLPQMRVGSLQRMSIGFKTVDAYREANVRHITDVELYECSIVTLSAHDDAHIIEGKSISNISEANKLLKNKGLTKKERDDVIYAIKNGQTCDENDDSACDALTIEDSVKKLTESIRNISNMYK